MKFLVLALGLLLCAGQAQAAAPAPANDPAITGVQVLEFGLYESGPKVQDLPPTPAGIGRSISEGFRHLRTTRLIPAQIGTTFGFRYKIEGAPSLGEVTTVLILPPPGIDSPLSGKIVTRDAIPEEVVVGGEDMMMMTFDYDWEIVPGFWTIEIWSGGRKLATETFEIIRALS